MTDIFEYVPHPHAEATYKDADAVLHEARQIQAHLAAQDAEIGKIVARLTAREAG